MISRIYALNNIDKVRDVLKDTKGKVANAAFAKWTLLWFKIGFQTLTKISLVITETDFFEIQDLLINDVLSRAYLDKQVFSGDSVPTWWNKEKDGEEIFCSDDMSPYQTNTSASCKNRYLTEFQIKKDLDTLTTCDDIGPQVTENG